MANALRQVFRIAQSGRNWPVLVDVTKDVTAALVDYVPERPLPLKEMPKATDEELQEIDERVTKELLGDISIKSCVDARVSFGGTAPSEVRRQIEVGRQWLNSLER